MSEPKIPPLVAGVLSGTNSCFVGLERTFAVSKNGCLSGHFFKAKTWPEVRGQVARALGLKEAGLEFYTYWRALQDGPVGFRCVSVGDPELAEWLWGLRTTPPLIAVEKGEQPKMPVEINAKLPPPIPILMKKMN